MTGSAPSSPLRQPEVVAAIREVARKSSKGDLRPSIVAMLIEKFGIHATKGQVAGAIWREGITVQGEEQATGGAAELARARNRREDDYRRGRLRAERQKQWDKEARAASEPGTPPMLAPQPLYVPPPPPIVAKRPVIEAPPPAPAARPAILRKSTGTCVWPIGNPRTPAFRSCDAPAHPDRPYCLDHCKKAYHNFVAERPAAAPADF